jgi:UDP-N-acetylmuramate dehydrogenase
LQLSSGVTELSLLDRRAATQPTGQPSCGSTFRNPPGDHAARLIEASGLKGFRIGGAEVSPKHANFIINTGSATATDIERLITHVRAEVLRCQGVALRPEVHMIGEPT